MIFSTLSLHSLVRWLVMLLFIGTIFNSFRKWKYKKPIHNFDRVLLKSCIFVFASQILIGLYLYWSSPIVAYFLNNIKDAMHETQPRFFGMEHITAMSVSFIIVLIGAYKAKHKRTDIEYFKTLALWFTFAFIIVFCSIPWSFSPFTSRPDFRFLGY